MIQAIFYARFLPQEGTKIVAQSPPGCIVASPDAPNGKPPLLDFDIIQEYIIPRKAFFNRFSTVNSPDDKYSVLGFPVSIPNERYHRNEFLFNFGVVIESDADQIPYERLVRRLAVTFAEMERQNGYLSTDGTARAAEEGRLPIELGGRRPIESLLEIIKEDLNNYGECMIPIDEANTLNMKLFPYQPPPAAVRGWHVPVPKVKLAEIMDPTWDLTLQKIIPHVDGVNDVRRVAWLADVSLPLCQVALQHLLYYDTILLLDMFFFGSCYAPRPAIHDFIANRDGLIDECAGYVCVQPPPAGTTDAATMAAAATAMEGLDLSAGKAPEDSHSQDDGDHSTPTSAPTTTASVPTAGAGVAVSHYQLIRLMTTFCAGRNMMEWIKLHMDTGFDVLQRVDVRRLVQFGVIKGLLYRVHKYVVSKRYLSQLVTGQVPAAMAGPAVAIAGSTASRRGSPAHAFAEAKKAGRGGGGGEGGGGGGGLAGRTKGKGKEVAATAAAPEPDDADAGNPLRKYTDGTHCFDQIITEQNMTDAQIMDNLKSFQAPAGDLTVFYR